MSAANEIDHALAREISKAENDLRQSIRDEEYHRHQAGVCRRRLTDDRARLAALRARLPSPPSSAPIPHTDPPLPREALARYGRQLVLREIGLRGQRALSRARVLVVGAGGLGVPAATYLAGAGVGSVTVADGDDVEVGNLARQVVYGACVGRGKAESLVEFMTSLNPLGKYAAHAAHVTPATAPSLFAAHDVVLDCTDAPWTRYMLSDAAVAARKPLVSGAALRLDAQLLVLNQPPGEGPCYRCVFPRPPHLGGEGGVAAPTCADAGVLGPVVGMMGCLMAAKALLLLLPPPAPSASAPAPACRTANSSESQPPPSEPAAPLAPAFDPDVDPAREMLVFAAAATPPFRSVRLRGRRAGCLACGAAPSADVKEQWMVEAARAYDPPAFCAPVPANGTPVGGLPNPRQEGELPQQPPRVTARELAASEADGRIVLDVRPRAQFDLCALRGAVSAPWDELAPGFDRQRWLEHAREAILSPHGRGQTEQQRVYVVCRNGNDSQAAARALSEDGLCAGGGRWIGDVVGGLKAWRDEVDADFPEY